MKTNKQQWRPADSNEDQQIAMKTNRYAILATWFMVAVGRAERSDLSFVFGGKTKRKR